MNNITQANVLVAKGAIADAGVVNSTLDDIVKQLAVNRQHMDLFFSLYLKTVDRLLGEDIARPADTLSGSTAWVKGSAGGWLKVLAGVSSPSGIDTKPFSSTGASTVHPLGRGVNASHLDSIPFPLSGILQKFVPGSPIFELLSRIQGGCEIKTVLLPMKMQMFIADHPLYPYARTKYHQYILGSLLKYTMHTSNQRNYIINKQSLLLDPMEHFFVCLMRYPTISNAHISIERSSVDSYSSSSSSSLRRSSTPTRSNVVETLHNRGISAWIRSVPYLALLQEYFREYVPINMKNVIDLTNPPLETPSILEHDIIKTRQQELFLHLAVAYWIDVAVVLKVDHGKLGILRKQLSGATAGMTSDIAAGAFVTERPHPSPTELELLDTSSMRWTTGTMQCTYLLLLRVLADPQLLQRVEEAGHAVEVFHSGSTNTAGGYGGRRSPLLPSSSGAVGSFRTAWQLLQVPMFDMLKCLFVKGDSSSSLDGQVVLLGVEAWALWLQPWNALVLLNSTTGVLPTRTGSLTGFTEAWRPYVAANLHFYTTLLACFLKWIARGQLSVTDPEGARLLFTLERILQIFTPALMQCISDLQSAFADWYIPLHPQVGGYRGGGMRDTLLQRSAMRGTPAPLTRADPLTEGFVPNTVESPALGAGYRHSTATTGAEEAPVSPSKRQPVSTQQLYLMQYQHRKLFPDRRIDALEDCGITDVRFYAEQAGIDIVSQLYQINEHSVVEEDYVAKAITAMASFLRARFNQPPLEAPRGKHHDRLVRTMNKVISLVPGAAVGRAAATPRRNRSATATAALAGTDSNLTRELYSARLTDFGREQILTGHDKCRVTDLLQPRALSRDPMDLPICSYENALLVYLTVRLSRYLNTRFQLPIDQQQIMCSWENILKRYYNTTINTATTGSSSSSSSSTHSNMQQQTSIYPSDDYFIKYRELYTVICQAFRFNLRGFASYRTIAFIGIVSFLCFYSIGILSMFNLTIAMTFFCLIAFYNGNFFM